MTTQNNTKFHIYSIGEGKWIRYGVRYRILNNNGWRGWGFYETEQEAKDSIARKGEAEVNSWINLGH